MSGVVAEGVDDRPIPCPMTDATLLLRPYTTEEYEGELRESYDDRPDLLKHRSLNTNPAAARLTAVIPTAQGGFLRLEEADRDSDDGGVAPSSSSPFSPVEVRLYRYGRSDGVREVEARVDGSFFAATFAPYPHRSLKMDGAVTAVRWMDGGSGSWNYAVQYAVAERAKAVEGAAAAAAAAVAVEGAIAADGDAPAASLLLLRSAIRSVHISLERGERVVVGPLDGPDGAAGRSAGDERDANATADNAVSLIKRKVNHVAVKLDHDYLYDAQQSGASEDVAAIRDVCEVYQDVGESKTLRISTRNAFGRTVSESFPLFQLNGDGRYEVCRRLVMEGLRLVVSMERDLAALGATVGLGWEGVA